MPAPVLNAKFLRSFHVNPTPGIGATACMGWVMRLMFEFWGFCVNGSNDLVNPGSGSMATTAGTDFMSMPIGWASGSTVLLATGSDGQTTQGLPYFQAGSSTPFSSGVVGKWLTTWQSGSTSTDDSIYLITSWLNSSSIVLDPTYGGTPVSPIGTSGSLPQLTTRTNINYRVIDYQAAANLGYANGDYFVMQFSNASNVNPGQASSQARLRGTAGQSTLTNFGITLSPSGSWNGTSFTGEVYTEVLSEGNIAGPGGGGHTGDWFFDFGSSNGYVTVIAGPNFFICQIGSAEGGFQGFSEGGGSCCTIEIPQRLYPQASDPNPICCMNFGSTGVGVGSQVGYGFAHRFFPSPYDSLTRRWPIMARCPTGSYWHSTPWQSFGIQGGNIGRWEFFYNQPQNKFIAGDGILCMATLNGQASSAGQFSLARARVLSTRFTSGAYQYYLRVGDDHDKWIHVGGGVLWPWDHAVISGRPLFAGF